MGLLKITTATIYMHGNDPIKLIVGQSYSTGTAFCKLTRILADANTLLLHFEDDKQFLRYHGITFSVAGDIVQPHFRRRRSRQSEKPEE